MLYSIFALDIHIDTTYFSKILRLHILDRSTCFPKNKKSARSMLFKFRIQSENRGMFDRHPVEKKKEDKNN